MRDNVRAFVEIATAAFDLAGPVYEFGSYLVPGQERLADLRGVFPGRRYVGCDLRPGPGVDRVEDLARLSLADHAARTILCLDTLEHVFEARRAVDEMIRVLAPGGVLMVSVPMDFRVHDFPSDYWRFTPSCLTRLLAPLEASIVGWQGTEKFPHTVFGIGCKTPVTGKFVRAAPRFVQEFDGWLRRSAAQVGWRQKLKQAVAGRVRSKGERRRLRERYTARWVLNLPLGRPVEATPMMGEAASRSVTPRRVAA